ncbi:MAG: hypothetical protein IIB17_00200 [Chloroflexi bacterium]|nr:hypothetical protein [Chloroflexota bacterium]
MTQHSKHFKWAAVVPAMLIMVLSVTVVYGGLRWSGIDPEVSLDDHTLNITAQWHSETLCSVNGDIQIDVYVPDGVTVGKVKESSATCSVYGGTVTISTDTNIYKTNSNKVTVTGLMTSDENMPARLLLDLDGKHIRTCGGQTNSLITCGSFNLK